MSTEIEVHRPLVKASSELSAYLGMEVSTMIDALKSQCFKGKRSDEVTNAQLATYISTANALKLNPLLPGQMYAYPDRQGGGVTVMIGPDGVFTLLSNHPDVIAQKDGGPAFWTEHGVDPQGKETCTGYINHRTKGLLKKTIWVDEWVVSSNPNWVTRRHHMSEIRAQKQVARMVIHGLPVDSDEHKLGEMLNVTDSVDQPATTTVPETPAPKRSDPPARSRKGAGAVTPPADDGKTINVETVPPKTETPPPPAQEKPAEKVAEKVAEKTAPPATVETKTESGPRTSLNENETITAKCVVKKLHFMNVNMEGVLTPSVHAIVDGEFSGPVYHFGAAKQGAEGLEPNRPEWVVGKTVVLSLFGRINKKTNNVLARVDKLEATEGQPNTAEIEV